MASRCRAYSPGALNFTAVVPLPLNGWSCLPPFITSSFGRAGSKVTVPGPRYLFQCSSTGDRLSVTGAMVALENLPSSSTQALIDSGVPTVAVSDGALLSRATGPLIAGPFCSSTRSVGGSLPTATSPNGLTL